MRASFVAGILIAFAVPALGQSTVHEFENRHSPEPAPDLPRSMVSPDALAAPIPGELRIKLASFRFTGVQSLSPDVLSAELSGYIGRNLSARDLHAAAQIVAEAYLRRGLMARVRVTGVVVAEGVAEIAVNEMRVGKLLIEYPPGTRIRPEFVQRILLSGVETGTILPLARLESGIAVLNAQPGIAAAIGLDGGLDSNEVDITVRLNDRPVLAGRLFADNHGVREIGQERVGMNLRLENALGLAERFALDTEEAGGSSLLSPLLSLPVGSDGMRASVSTTSARYRAKRAGASLQLSGRYDRWQGTLLQPILRGPLALRAEYALQRTEYRDSTIFGNLQNRRIDAGLFRLEGIARSISGTTRLQLDIERGQADLSGNSSDMATDGASSRIHGRFWRLRWRIGREAAYGGDTLVLRASGQFADRNLDATQQFALGGPNGVRAYPTAEALGDSGWLATAEWRHRLDDECSAQIFLDSGGIQRNSRPWTNQRNRNELSGLGAGMRWQLPDRLRVTFEAAHQLGSNPGRNPDGTDSDGRSSRWRAWLSVQHEF